MYKRQITGAPLHHRLELDGRERLTVSGVEDVARFDETCIVMSTCVGELVVTGEGLHIGKLTLDGGELHVDGHIDSVSYEEMCIRDRVINAPPAPHFSHSWQSVQKRIWSCLPISSHIATGKSVDTPLKSLQLIKIIAYIVEKGDYIP